MKKTKLNYTFHNPNTEEETIKYISKVFTDVSKNKFERVLREIAEQEIITPEEYSTV